MYTTHPPIHPNSTPIPLLTANNTTLPRRHQCAHFNPTSPSLTTMRCTRPVIHITLQARLRRCMTAAASAGRAPIEPHRCILRVTNCCRVGNLPAYLPACLQSSTGLVRWCAYCWDLYHYNVIIIHSSSYCDPEIQVKAPRFTAHSGRCQAASCLDRMSSASETDVQIYMWYYGTKLSDDISPLRSMYVLGSGHSPDHHRRIRWVAEDLFTCLPEQQPIYTCISA